MKSVIFSKRASAALVRHSNRADFIKAKIEQYAFDPKSQANHVIVLKGSGYLRLRVGDFRVIFRETTDSIGVVDVGSRGEIYRNYR